MKMLLIHYLPRGARSRTRRLVDAWRREAKDHDLKETDLAASPPAAFNVESLAAYEYRNYLGEALDDERAALLAESDRFVADVEAADIVVLAFPVFNFSVPAAVKAWMDAVTQKGRTWTLNESGYCGLLRGKKALILMTAGGRYDGPRSAWDHAAPLARHIFEFMGFDDIRVVRADGLNSEPAPMAESRLSCAEGEVRQIAAEWLAPIDTFA
ncbi:MAG TPA: NAD(P)H-dependent oxidoreductase [Kiritimatiellia bacterium]|nr:NAD(P)H-dependent oxidoreductase [Kiritimatiellia bacterium]HMP00176.1 NAD(P)H-dependent oxidoreductase [Kiritimatiellia bacterium]HMP96799.1 NAD(P)H-dependent oxidoreductase [Kiritimatiellia bacterium]